MIDLRATIEDELTRRGWSRYQLAKIVQDEIDDEIGSTTIYDYLAGRSDCGARTVEALLCALDLEVRPVRGAPKPAPPLRRGRPPSGDA